MSRRQAFVVNPARLTERQRKQLAGGSVSAECYREMLRTAGELGGSERRRRGQTHSAQEREREPGRNYEAVRKRKSKYNSRRTVVDGIVFDSSWEARRYRQLSLLCRAGRITNLRLQVSFALEINGHHIANYVADFVYEHVDLGPIVEDAKGMLTPVYRLKRKLMLALHGIEIYESRLNEVPLA